MLAVVAAAPFFFRQGSRHAGNEKCVLLCSPFPLEDSIGNHSIETGIASFTRCFTVPTDEPYARLASGARRRTQLGVFRNKATGESSLLLAGWKVKMEDWVSISPREAPCISGRRAG